MTKGKKPPKPYLRVRSYPDRKRVTLWLCVEDGPTHAALMWGEMLPELAEAIAGMTGLPVRREDCPVDAPPQTPPGCLPVAGQGDFLFE